MTYADLTPEPELSAADLQAAGGHPNRLGVKHDHGKRRWGLMPWAAAGAVVDVLGFGAKKYAPDNWRKVPDARGRYFDAALRHLIAWQQGERLDPESGLSHLAHAACCVLFLLEVGDAEDPS